jgi:hypothetical protein
MRARVGLRSCTRATCQCGSLTATISDDAEPFVALCHCIACQKRSGSPFGVMAYYDDHEIVIAGDVREYTRPSDTGNTFTTGFCPTCGSTIFGRPSGMPGIIGVTVGTITDRSLPQPMRSVYEQSRHPWVAMPAETQGFTRGRDSERTR